MLERVETEIANRLTSEFYNFNLGENLESSLPSSSKVTAWIALAVPLLGFLSYVVLKKVVHDILVRLLQICATSIQKKQPQCCKEYANKVSRSKALQKDKKVFIETILFTDILCCILCFGLYGVPLGDFMRLDSKLMVEPDYNQISRLYTPTTYWSSEELHSSCYDQTNYGFFRKTHQNSTSVPLDKLLVQALNNNPKYPSVTDEMVENRIEESDILELIQTYQVLTQWQFESDNSMVAFRDTINQISPLGIIFKDIVYPQGSADNPQEGRPSTPWTKVKTRVCTVCYPSPLIYGWLTELLLVYGLLLLLGILVVRRYTSLYTLCFYTMLSVILPSLSHMYVEGLHRRDVYNLLVPSRSLSQILQPCLTVYARIQTQYPAYYIIITHACLKLTLIYLYMVFSSVKRLITKGKILQTAHLP